MVFFHKRLSELDRFPIRFRSKLNMEYPGFQRIFYLISIIRGEAALTRRKAPRRKNNLWSQEHATSFPCEIQFRNWTGSPIGYSHVRRELTIWQWPWLATSNNFTVWDWWDIWSGSRMEMRLHAPVTRGNFFSSALCASLTRLRREISIRKKYPLEPRVLS